MTERTMITPDGPKRVPGMGLVRDTEDRRDRVLFRALPNIDQMPDSASCAHLLPPKLDQKVIGACAGYTVARDTFMIMKREYQEKRRKGRPFVASPVFLYGEARRYGEADWKRTGHDSGVRYGQDTGCMLRDVYKAAAKLGLPPMSNLKPRFEPRDIPDQNTWTFPEGSIWVKPPTPGLLADAERRQALAYYRMPTLNDILQSIVDGYPVSLGIEIFRSFYGPGGPRFNVPDPDPTRERSLGGHAISGIEMHKPSRRVLCENQWGADAHEGKSHFTVSFDYLTKYSWDCWSPRVIEGSGAVA